MLSPQKSHTRRTIRTYILSFHSWKCRHASNLTNWMWFNVICPLLCKGMRHHRGQNVVDSRGAKPHSIWFLPQYQRQRKWFFRERKQDRDTKKEQALYITFSQSDWSIAQDERFWLVITTRNDYHKNSELSEATAKLNVYSRNYDLNCLVTANIQWEL